MALAVRYNLKLYQLDIETAFLNREIEEEVYMEKPDLLQVMLTLILKREDKHNPTVQKAKVMLNNLKHGDMICRLQKVIYGLRQAGRQWHLKLDNKLRRLGLLPTNADSCVYKAKRNGSTMIVMTYVDDMLIACDNVTWLKSLKEELIKDFKVRDLGLASCCLGIQIQQKKEEIKLTQEKYINDVLLQFGMNEANPISTPMDPGSRLDKRKRGRDDNKTNRPYRELIGFLMYIAIGTRPDIAHSVSALSQFNDCFDDSHWSAAKRIHRYLKGTVSIGLMFKKSFSGQLEGYVDAD